MATKSKKGKIQFSTQMLIPLVAIIVLVLINVVVDIMAGKAFTGSSFFSITVNHNNLGNPVLAGNIVAILNNGSELALLAIGMTLVTAASGGQDISVGATMAIAGSIILRIVCGTDGKAAVVEQPIILAFLVALIAVMACGAFNGALVSWFNIPPMVATLILYTAGRSIAAWVNNNQCPSTQDTTFAIFGNNIPGCPIPTPIFIAIIMFVIMGLILKFTNLGLYVQSVGINPEAARLNGLNPKFIKFITFVILGVCVAFAALIKVSRTSTINYSVFAKDIEMDAILAVAFGGNSLGGGKFKLSSSIIGAYVIQFLSTTLLVLKVNASAIPAFKAVMVIVLVVISAPAVQDKYNEFKKQRKLAKEAA